MAFSTLAYRALSFSLALAGSSAHPARARVCSSHDERAKAGICKDIRTVLGRF